MDNNNNIDLLNAPEPYGRLDPLTLSFPSTYGFRHPEFDIRAYIESAMKKDRWSTCRAEFNSKITDFDRSEFNSYEEDAFCKWREETYRWINDRLLNLWKMMYRPVRIRKEAADMCASLWIGLIFGSPVQDNGDPDSISNMFGTMAKKTALDKFHKYLKENEILEPNYLLYLEKHISCAYMRVDSMSCDYHFDCHLGGIMKWSSGIPENIWKDLAPWKTGVFIDPVDHIVTLKKYNKYTEY